MMNSMCPPPLCLETRKVRLAEGGLLPSPTPRGSDLGLLRSLPFSLAPSLPWGPEQGNKGREPWQGACFCTLSALSFPGESFLLTSLLIYPAGQAGY